VAGVGAGTGGWFAGLAAGAALGSAVPIIGTTVGGIVGGLIGGVSAGCLASWGLKAGMDRYIEDDSVRMRRLVHEAMVELCEDHLLTELEVGEFAERVVKEVDENWLREMFKTGSSSESPEMVSQQYAYNKLDEVCFEITKKREAIALPPFEALVPAILEFAENILKAEEELDEVKIKQIDNDVLQGQSTA